MLPIPPKVRKYRRLRHPLSRYYLFPLRSILNPCYLLFRSFPLNNIYDVVADIRNPKALKISSWKALYWLRTILIVLIDSSAIALGWLISKKIGTRVENFSFWGLGQNRGEISWIWLIIAVNLGILLASGLYGTDERSRSYANLVKALSLAQITLLLIAFLIEPGIWVSRSVFLAAWLLNIIFVGAGRSLLNFTLREIRGRCIYLRRKVLLLGNKEDTAKARQLLKTTKTFGIQGIVDLSICQDRQKWSEILEQACSQKIDEIFICSWENIKDPIPLLWELKSAGINWRILAVNLILPKQWSEMAMIGGMPTIRFYSSAIVGADFWCKRIFDMIISSLLLILLALPMLSIALLIKLDSPGSVFYKQTRVGLKGRHFKVWKFRTMVENASQLQKELEAKNEVRGGVLFKIKDDPRITKVGKFLRRYSLDELPQLINILRGEMSLVGPRPLPVRDVDKFAPHHFLRHEVLPGITGLWQVSGRSNTDSEAVFKLDFAYIQNWSLALDLQILLKTVQVVLSSKGAY
jgi:exopolysaccharide biosynthesis polyprenyl glycosylphosphotransferase